MRVLIVAHKQTTRPNESYDFPLGIAYISAALKKAGFDVDCMNLNHHDDHLGAFVGRLEASQPDVVALGGLSPRFFQIDELLKLVRTRAPGAVSVVGGGVITGDPEMVYGLLEPDYGVIGEGEVTAVELLRAIEDGTDPADVEGIVFRDKASGRVIVTTPRRPIKDLDQIAFPDLGSFDFDRDIEAQERNDSYFYHTVEAKPRMVPIISSRGCPYNCSFCFHPLGSQYRMRSLDDFFAEVDHLIERYRVNYLCVYDELLSSKRERIDEFCRRMETYGIQWMTQLRVDSVDEELLTRLKRSGCNLISYGIESASNVVLKSMGKRITVEQVQRALDLTRKSRIGIQGNLIFGDRAETAQSVDESFRWYDDHSEYLLGLGMISCYPGSPLYRYAKEQGLIRNLEYFLRSGGGIVNVTAMPELEFQRIWLVSEYSAAKAQLDNRVAPQLARVTGRDQRGDRLYEFTTKCPKCGAANSYEDFNVASGGCLLMCKTCLQRSWLSFAPLKDYWAVFVNGSFVRLPPRIGYPAFITYWRLRHLSDFTLRQNILRVSRFVSKWARARRRSRGEEAAS